jgi:hypothetical protein
MLDDAVKSENLQEKLEVMDIAEIALTRSDFG